MNGLDFKKERKRIGYTQEEAGVVVGKSLRTISGWEKEEKENLDKYIKILTNSEHAQNTHKTRILNEVQETQTKYLAKTIKKGVPYYDIEFTSGFQIILNSQNVSPDSYISHPFFAGCDFVVRNSGQSMAKVIKHGDAIGLKKIANWQEFFPFGEVYAIVTKNDLRLIKVISKGETEECYTLKSKPTESKMEDFPDQQIKIKNIISIFKVQASSNLF